MSSKQMLGTVVEPETNLRAFLILFCISCRTRTASSREICVTPWQFELSNLNVIGRRSLVYQQFELQSPKKV